MTINRRTIQSRKLTVRFSINNTQLKTIGSTPVEIVPAPGLGRILIPSETILVYNPYGNNPYYTEDENNKTIYDCIYSLMYTGSNPASQVFKESFATLLDSDSRSIAVLGRYSSDTGSPTPIGLYGFENTALVFGNINVPNEFGTFGGGNSGNSLDVFVTYRDLIF